MSDLLDFSGSDKLGVSNFYKKTNRYSARDFEDNKADSFINPDTGEIYEELKYYHDECPLCKSKEASTIFNKSGYDHQKCNECDFIYVNPSLAHEVILNDVYGETPYPFFDTVNSDSQREFDKKRFNSVIDFLEKDFPEKKSIYDIGCGSGYFLHLCKERGFTKTDGIDALKRSADYAKEEFNLNVDYGDYKIFKGSTQKYDVISMWELLDHVTDPLDLFEVALERLNDDGILVISVRNGLSLAARVLREKCNMFLGYAHTNFWNTKSIELLEQKFNLKIRYQKTYISELGPVKNFLNFEDPYRGNSKDIEGFISADDVLDNMLGYKFITVLQKI